MMIFLFLTVGVLLGHDSMAQDSGTIIPLYIWPKADNGANNWQPLLDAYRAHPIPTWAIVNVNSGPGNEWDETYGPAIEELHQAGINTIGYVSTDYTNRNQAVAKAEIEHWKSFYSVRGIFFDEMAFEDDVNKVRYYQELGHHAKTLGLSFTVGNPGTLSDPKYFYALDTIVIFETDTGFPSNERLCSQNTNGKGRDAVSILPYNIPTFNAAQVSAARECARYIYVTNDVLPNPWDTLPSYLTEMFRVLRG